MSRALAALAFFATAALAAPPLSPRLQAEDFDAMWRAIDADYAYFDRQRDDWKRVRDAWRPRAERALSRDDFLAVLEGALSSLHDDHASLSERSASSARRVPYEADIGARWKDGQAVVDAVRVFGDADVAGVRPGQIITRVDGVPVDRAMREAAGPGTPTRRSAEWALQHLLAGPRSGVQRIEVRERQRAAAFEVERREPIAANGPAILGRRMGDERDIGYLRIRVGAPDERFAEHFDGALHHLRDARGLIVDLRDNSGPGSRDATIAVLSRFVAAETKWQLRESRGRARVADSVAPRGDFAYRAPVVVLVDRWTAGEGEALAAGLKAVAHARVIGTATAGLRGELREVRLPHSAIGVRFPAQKTLTPGGEPREALRPDLLVDLAAPSGGPGDPILYQALKAF